MTAIQKQHAGEITEKRWMKRKERQEGRSTLHASTKKIIHEGDTKTIKNQCEETRKKYSESHHLKIY